MADLGAILDEVAVESRATDGLDSANRCISASEIRFPVALRQVGDIGEFRRKLTRAVAGIGRVPDSKGPGNPTKRLRLSFSIPEDLSLIDLVNKLGGSSTGTSTGSGFAFSPKAPGSSQEMSQRQAQSETIVTHVHAEIQARLFGDLVSECGEENVSAENVMAVGNPADIVVRSHSGYAIYEVKTSLLPRQCIRQAVGQLLEYGYWNGSPNVVDLVVVGPSRPDQATEDYLGVLRSRFGLPLRYLWVPESGDK